MAFISPAVTALEIVHSAFATVKSNKGHLESVVRRCEVVVENLEIVAEERGEAWTDLRRIARLVRSFDHIADTMRRVGRRKWWQLLLHSGSDSLAIEDCHRLISDLIVLFNLHELVDMHRSNRVQTAQRAFEHEEILWTTRRVEKGNAEVLTEIKRQNSRTSSFFLRANAFMNSQRPGRRSTTASRRTVIPPLLPSESSNDSILMMKSKDKTPSPAVAEVVASIHPNESHSSLRDPPSPFVLRSVPESELELPNEAPQEPAPVSPTSRTTPLPTALQIVSSPPAMHDLSNLPSPTIDAASADSDASPHPSGSSTDIIHELYSPHTHNQTHQHPHRMPLIFSKTTPLALPPPSLPTAAPLRIQARGSMPPSKFFPRPFDSTDLDYLDTKIASLQSKPIADTQHGDRKQARDRRLRASMSALPLGQKDPLSRNASLSTAAGDGAPGRRPSIRRTQSGATVAFDVDTVAPQRPNTYASKGTWDSSSHGQGHAYIPAHAAGRRSLHVPPASVTANNSYISNRAVRGENSPAPEDAGDTDVQRWSVGVLVDGAPAKAKPEARHDRKLKRVRSSASSLTTLHDASVRLSSNGLQTDQRSDSDDPTVLDEDEPEGSSSEQLDADSLHQLVDVYLIPDLPDDGAILAHADRIGCMTRSALNELIRETPESSEWSSPVAAMMSIPRPPHIPRQSSRPLISQRLQIVEDSSDIPQDQGPTRMMMDILRLAPSANPYSLVVPISSLPASYPQMGRLTRPRVILVHCLAPVVTVSIASCSLHEHARSLIGKRDEHHVVWAVFPWPFEITIEQMKRDIAALLVRSPRLGPSPLPSPSQPQLLARSQPVDLPSQSPSPSRTPSPSTSLRHFASFAHPSSPRNQLSSDEEKSNIKHHKSLASIFPRSLTRTLSSTLLPSRSQSSPASKIKMSLVSGDYVDELVRTPNAASAIDIDVSMGLNGLSVDDALSLPGDMTLGQCTSVVAASPADSRELVLPLRAHFHAQVPMSLLARPGS